MVRAFPKNGASVTTLPLDSPPAPRGSSPRDAGAICLWRPLPFFATLTRKGTDPAPCRWQIVLAFILLNLLCIASSLAMVRLDWNGLPFEIGTLRIYVTLYPALILCTWALFWFGFLWAFIPAYLATLIGALSAGMPLAWAALFAFADPIGLAVYALAYRSVPLRHDLRSGLALFWFAFVSIVAVLAGSSGAFIWAQTLPDRVGDPLSLWEGWWVGALLQSLLVVAPVLAAAGPAVMRWRDRCFGPTERLPITAGRLAAITLGGSAVLAIFTWVSGLLARNRVDDLLHSSLPLAVRTEIEHAMEGVDLIVLHTLALLVLGAIGALLLAPTWNAALQREVSLRTAELRESEERYALAAQAANDGLWEWDLVSGKFYFSPRWFAGLGFEPRESTTRLTDWLVHIHANEREAFRTALEAHLAGHTSSFEGEYRLRHRDGSWRSMLVRGLAVRDSVGRATRIAGSQTDITDRRRAEDQLLHDAFHDQVTGLPNRALFLDRLAGSIARSRRHSGFLFAVLFLDLDRFKVINDSLGHAAGDRLLTTVASRLTACLRHGDTVARLGGDEFAVLLDDLGHLDEAVAMAEQIHRELGRPFRIEGTEIFPSASIGIATSKTGYQQPEEVLRDADTAMYRAKSLGKARHQVFDTEMHARAVNLLLLEGDLRRALEERSFEVHYQPIVRLADRSVLGFEALLRWSHPARGMIPQGEYLPLAEETGLITPIGWWVLAEACRQIADWGEQFPQPVPLWVSVNLSARQLVQPELITEVESALAEHGLAAARLRLEITEGAVLEQSERALAAVDRLSSLGVRIDLDDFGTGYSSLSYLHRLPIDRVKIDRSFIASINEQSDSLEIVRAIIGLSRSLGMEVVAEGIEREAQATTLRALGCELAQGFFFSPPLVAREAERYLRAARR